VSSYTVTLSGIAADVRVHSFSFPSSTSIAVVVPTGHWDAELGRAATDAMTFDFEVADVTDFEVSGRRVAVSGRDALITTLSFSGDDVAFTIVSDHITTS